MENIDDDDEHNSGGYGEEEGRHGREGVGRGESGQGPKEWIILGSSLLSGGSSHLPDVADQSTSSIGAGYMARLARVPFFFFCCSPSSM
jgi:hypothetical protein